MIYPWSKAGITRQNQQARITDTGHSAQRAAQGLIGSGFYCTRSGSFRRGGCVRQHGENVTFHFTVAVPFDTTYKLSLRIPRRQDLGYSPKEFKVLGSHDGIIWHEVLSQVLLAAPARPLARVRSRVPADECLPALQKNVKFRAPGTMQIFPFRCTLPPTGSPTMQPTITPTKTPTSSPTQSPSLSPTTNPTSNPTSNPTQVPTAPTRFPTKVGVTWRPSASPSASPSTTSPSGSPSSSPTATPSASPSASPSSVSPTSAPATASPTAATSAPTSAPSSSPTTPWVCYDTPQWNNGAGNGCAVYSNVYCDATKKKARTGFEWAFGPQYNNPETNCCRCGKSPSPPTSGPTSSPTPAPTHVPTVAWTHMPGCTRSAGYQNMRVSQKAVAYACDCRRELQETAVVFLPVRCILTIEYVFRSLTLPHVRFQGVGIHPTGATVLAMVVPGMQLITAIPAHGQQSVDSSGRSAHGSNIRSKTAVCAGSRCRHRLARQQQCQLRSGRRARRQLRHRRLSHQHRHRLQVRRVTCYPRELHCLYTISPFEGFRTSQLYFGVAAPLRRRFATGYEPWKLSVPRASSFFLSLLCSGM